MVCRLAGDHPFMRSHGITIASPRLAVILWALHLTSSHRLWSKTLLARPAVCAAAIGAGLFEVAVRHRHSRAPHPLLHRTSQNYTLN
jgi:hypothetical protein